MSGYLTDPRLEGSPSSSGAGSGAVATCIAVGPWTMQSSAEVDGTIAVRLAQIKYLQTEITGLQHRRNSLQPINRLPNEVLQMIFALCLPHPVWEHAGNGWLQITAVCSHWRQVAISYPYLWNDADATLCNKWALAYIERSAPGPVDIEVWLEEDNEGLTEAIIRNIARIRVLKVEGNTARMLDLLSQLKLAAPRLESLKLGLIGKERNDPRVALLPSLFANQAPRLFAMDLSSDIFLPETCSFLPQLRELESMREVTTPRALRTITRLTNIFRLCMGISDDGPVESPVSRTMITNNTTEILNFDLRTPMLSINILNSLYYPSLKSLNLSLRLCDDVWTESHIQRVLKPVASHVQVLNRNTQGLVELLADYADSDTVSFRARADPEDEYDDPDWDPFDGVALDFYWNQTLEPEFCGSHIIFPILELFKDIEILKISDSNSLGRDILVSADPNWRGLHLYRRDCCPLPKLTKLVIKSEKIRMFGGTLLRVLLAFVTYRRDMYDDAAIGEIDFARCNGYSAYITSQLGKHDVDVTWDGIYVEPCALDETRMGRSMRHIFSKRGISRRQFIHPAS